MQRIHELKLRPCENVWTSNVILSEIIQRSRRPRGPPETPGDPLQGVFGGCLDFLAKSLVIPAQIQNSSLSITNLSLNFVHMAGIISDLAKKSRHPPKTPLQRVSRGLWGSPGSQGVRSLRIISDGITLLVHTFSQDLNLSSRILCILSFSSF